MTIIHQPTLAVVSSNICSQMHVQIHKAFSIAYLQDFIPTLSDVFLLVTMSSIESQGQEEAAYMHHKAYTTTTVSYLHGWQL